MTSSRDCYVYIVLPDETAFTTAGRFQASVTDGLATGHFVYGRSYRERRDAVELDPAELLLVDELFETSRMNGFFGVIRDAMPDHWGRLVIERQRAETPDEFDYLLHGADDRAGALGFGVQPEPPQPRSTFASPRQLGDLQRQAEALLAGDGSGQASMEHMLLLGTSMGGARPKVVVEDAGALWLAKLSRPDDRWNQPRVEAGMLALARACGINAATGHIRTVGDRDALLVRRFDRERADAGYRRARMASALTLLRCDEGVTERGKWAYPLLADEVRRISAAPHEDLRELFTRMCFNAAVSNLDDHPRNHAMIAWQRGWRLSPAYDLVPIPSVAQERRHLAMACGKLGRWANRDNLLSAAGRFLLHHEEAATIFDRILNTVRARWRSALQDAGASPADCDVVASAFDYPGLTLMPSG